MKLITKEYVITNKTLEELNENEQKLKNVHIAIKQLISRMEDLEIIVDKYEEEYLKDKDGYEIPFYQEYFLHFEVFKYQQTGRIHSRQEANKDRRRGRLGAL